MRARTSARGATLAAASRARAAAFAVSTALVFATASGRADDGTDPAPNSDSVDPLDPLRERFRVGMDQYRAGRYAEAIVTWEAIYRELGSEKGYRLAFNLARAYDAQGDAIRAAEHYDTYLREVARRRASGQSLESNVERQEHEADARLSEIVKTIGRIHVRPGPRETLAQIDTTAPRIGEFVAYVTPRTIHTVTFGAGRDAERREVVAREGEQIDVTPKAWPIAPGSTSPKTANEPTERGPDDVRETRRETPFSPTVLWIAGATTIASLAVPAVTYARAVSVKSDYDGARDAKDVPEQQRLAADYDAAKRTAYVSLVVPAVLAAATGALAVWYVLGTKERPIVTTTPTVTLTSSSGGVGLVGTF